MQKGEQPHLLQREQDLAQVAYDFLRMAVKSADESHEDAEMYGFISVRCAIDLQRLTGDESIGGVLPFTPLELAMAEAFGRASDVPLAARQSIELAIRRRLRDWAQGDAGVPVSHSYQEARSELRRRAAGDV